MAGRCALAASRSSPALRAEVSELAGLAVQLANRARGASGDRHAGLQQVLCTACHVTKTWYGGITIGTKLPLCGPRPAIATSVMAGAAVRAGALFQPSGRAAGCRTGSDWITPPRFPRRALARWIPAT